MSCQHAKYIDSWSVAGIAIRCCTACARRLPTVVQTTPTSCGQAVAAMFADVLIDQVLAELPSHPRGTTWKELAAFLRSHGWWCATRLRRTARGRALPEHAILRVKWPDRRMGHWVAWIHGEAMDPSPTPVGRGFRVTSFLEVSPPSARRR